MALFAHHRHFAVASAAQLRVPSTFAAFSKPCGSSVRPSLRCRVLSDDDCEVTSLQQKQQQEMQQEQQQRIQQPQPSRWAAPWDLGHVSGSTVLATTGAGLFGLQLDGPISSLQSIGVLAIIIAAHEFGHFQAARLQGIRVTKFAIGFGPPLFTKTGEDGVEYSLRLFPLGGYVAFPGEDRLAPERPNATEEQKLEAAKEESERVKFDPADPDLLKNRSIIQRGIVISAGVVANIVFAYATLLLQVSTVGKAETVFLPGVRLPEITAFSAAERAGLRSGDIVLAVGDYRVVAGPQQVNDVVSRIQASPNKSLNFTVQRDGSVVEVPCLTDADEDTGDGRIGVRLTSMIEFTHLHPTSTAQTFEIASSEFNRLASTVLRGLSNIFSNFSKAASQLTGPVAIVAAGSDILRTDEAGIFQFCAIININLAAVNLLPLPGLDGGYLAFLLIEALRGGRKVPDEVEGAVMTSGLLLLLGSGLYLAVRDTMNLVM